MGRCALRNEATRCLVETDVEWSIGTSFGYVVGTGVCLPVVLRRLRRFVRFFRYRWASLHPVYVSALYECLRSGVFILGVNCQHLFDFDLQLYSGVIAFPRELMSLAEFVACDVSVHVLTETDVDWPLFEVRPFRLEGTVELTFLELSDTESLVAVRAQISRCSLVAPDVQYVVSRCVICGLTRSVGRFGSDVLMSVNCSECYSVCSTEIYHSQCEFVDRQFLQLREVDVEDMYSRFRSRVGVFCYDELVNFASTGFTVEVVSVLRMVPLKIGCRVRQVKSLFRNYLDSVHFFNISIFLKFIAVDFNGFGQWRPSSFICTRLGQINSTCALNITKFYHEVVESFCYMAGRAVVLMRLS